ncbi:MAG: SDR family NAD(P)-dependent oxidoreductase, partial [Algiphilus sp.]
IAVMGRTAERLQETVEGARSRGVKAIAVSGDVNDAEALAAAVDTVVRELGGLNILVNNAQQVPLGRLNDVEEDAFQAGWSSGPLATFRLMKLAYPHLRGDGNIINLASPAAMRWDASGYGCYGAVKEAIRQLTRAAACEWGSEGIRTNAILPLASSPAMAWWMREYPDESQAFVQTVPMQRIGDCEADIGRFVASLCSQDCAYVNGQSIALDGGQARIA